MSDVNERIALLIETTADLAAVKAARTETTALGQAARAANTEAQAGALGAAQAAQQQASAVNMTIGAFEAYGKQLDLTNREAVLAYRQQGDALAQNLASLDATEQELGRVGTAIAGVERAAGAAAAKPPVSLSTVQTIDKMPSSLRTAANGVNILSQAALTGRGSMAGLATAAGAVAFGISSVTKSAQIAAAATGIGALVSVGTLLYEMFQHVNTEAKATASQLSRLQGLTTSNVDARIAAQRQVVADAQKHAEGFSNGDYILPWTNASKAMRQYEQQLDLLNQMEDKRLEILHTEKLRRQELLQSADDQIRANARTLQLEQATAGPEKRAKQLQVEAAAQDDVIRQRFRIRDANGQIVALSDAERERMNTLLAQNRELYVEKEKQLALQESIDFATYKTSIKALSTDPREQMQAKIEAIREEELADVERYGSKELAAQKAERKIQALQRETVNQGISGYGKLADAMQQHGVRGAAAFKALGNAMEKYQIFTQAKSDWLMAKSEWAAAMASFGKHDYVGGALHLTASAGYAAAAAAAGVGAFGGAGGGAGGGGGGSGDSSGTFSPSSNGDGGQNLTLVLQTVDPSSRQVIGETQYQLRQASVLKRPIPIAPTRGFAMAGGIG